MKSWKILLATVVATLQLSLATNSVMAVTTPSFPTCSNPQGSTKVSYSDGIHGIVGSTNTYTGRDTVYQLDGNRTLMQCFCPSNGDGIQTNWWHAAHLSDDDLKILKNQGWIYVPNGSLWGLDNAPYLAKNHSYACLAKGNVVQGATVTSDPQASVLAATGNSTVLYGAIAAGFALIVTGRTLRSRQ